MTNIALLQSLGLFDARVPRYTSYPAAPVFSGAVGSEFQAAAIEALDPAVPISVYVHIPFCERLCWFCACRTQGTQTLAPVEAYVGTLLQELELVKKHLPAGVKAGRLHWGGGTPTILSPELIHKLAQAIKAVIPFADDYEFSVEIDPMMVDEPKIRALSEEGMNRASIGIQDFTDIVQNAIGREQPFENTLACVETLRRYGVNSLNTDLVYGLPHQNRDSLAATIDKVLQLRPDRVAIFGYAHVPWMAKRQKLIDETVLPPDIERHELANLAAKLFTEGGFERIGIDHFARPEDSMAVAARTGKLRRNFQGYTDDTCPTLLGIGASSISKFSEGYLQNTAATAAYIKKVEDGELPGYRGHRMTEDDYLHARAIEMIMCDFHFDMPALKAAFGDAADELAGRVAEAEAKFAPFVKTDATGSFTIAPEGRALARMIARVFDAYETPEARYSQAS
ncbi:oxygen-independent coproporphyrinogen III oxidase [Cereibacter sphaeroides]|uniref:oxygen-independent coproporphyrinogen III oxidase n=1 Tax=Rhodobacterales TaxID=204455 RepID=UPI000BBE8531|nr:MULTISPECIES: oxygen-independent coproporphyrinogen III oxidase [Paracoccaceae]MCE6950941.1 oxygen-independent coproporphyrinogen III oxidase [Cereibacter sphaeroides]MCE6960471.1 oxygen-independent coproporphyrinogen III oxidase [Cereibacter sphaeroides]MCE6969421.1 oxygen-independent coproporphyrinogen III oxidase [Cereibacter sphaeroides]MCE6975479.1 oxygen-independent coproporphyrinogen III oxidase [Cereibacter sphaeroides]